MALWQMERTGDEIRLTWTDHPGSPGALVQKCGQIGADARADLEAWVFDQAEIWDLCVTVEGAVLVRQAFASDTAPRRASLVPIAAAVSC